MGALLEIDGLTISTGGKVLVRDLSLIIAPGERLGVIGESGSGKSLTALAVMGLLPGGLRASGSVRLDGQQVVGAPERQLRALRGRAAAMVFQEPLTALDPLMRIGRQLAEPIRRRARRDGAALTRSALRAEIARLLDEVRLPDPARLIRAFPHEISGGQRQRIALAMALACRPDLLIADEPTTALDVTTQAELLDLLRRLVAERGMALMFITHDLPIVAQVSDRALVLRAGEAVESGPVDRLLRAPQHSYTQDLVAAARRFDDALEGRG